MNIRITPKYLSGKILVPPSKSISHRALIAAALADGESRIYNLLDCVDITDATIGALTALGAEIEQCDGYTRVRGIGKAPAEAFINCHESGSTLRFIMPIAAALGCRSSFDGRANLPNRPVTPYFDQFEKHGVKFLSKTMPYITEGRLTGGVYEIAGNISSQFITGFLFALALLEEDSVIKITSSLESRPYVDLTIDAMKTFGVTVEESENEYRIKGGQKYRPCDYTVEADMSQAAFFCVAKALGAELDIQGLNYDSLQGDREILRITDEFTKTGKAFDVNASQIPDLVPVLTVLGCFAEGTSYIRGCERLKIKECDRLAVTSEELNKLGGKVRVEGDTLVIEGVKELSGGECDCHTDHRIPMSLAVASQRCKHPVILRGAECVSKSYPNFFEDFRSLGGIADVI
ncbi:MAG: 3-phosphoshikimate 1-carboxyvinyltransferase [Ruminiclostridium sp.]|nr:3-phosphoshikimate 1-carboxyvinyltransferase [Ruminiclostridium sp.]